MEIEFLKEFCILSFRSGFKMPEPSGVVLVLRNLEARARQVILILVDRQPQAVVATPMTPASWVWARPLRIARVQ